MNKIRTQIRTWAKRQSGLQFIVQFLRGLRHLGKILPHLRELFARAEQSEKHVQVHQRELESLQAHQQAAIAAIREELAMLNARWEERMREDEERLRDVHRQLLRLTDELGGRENTYLSSTDADAFYALLERAFRGPSALVQERQKVYLPHITQTLAQMETPSLPVVDIGCGRGEWLGILHEQGIAGVGVDSNADLAASAQARGIEIHVEDALRYLRRKEDGAFAAVSAFHIVEHLPFPLLHRWLLEIFRVTAVGGIVILETPNPENVTVGGCNFYLDPTHTHPIPPELLKFTVWYTGFDEVEVILLHPHEDLQAMQKTHGEEIARRFCGHMDYAVIGRKTGQNIPRHIAD